MAMKLTLVTLTILILKAMSSTGHPNGNERARIGGGIMFPNEYYDSGYDYDDDVYERSDEFPVHERDHDGVRFCDSDEDCEESEEDDYEAEPRSEEQSGAPENLRAAEASCGPEDEFCENPSFYPAAAVQRVLARLNNEASPSSPNAAFFFHPNQVDDKTRKPVTTTTTTTTTPRVPVTTTTTTTQPLGRTRPSPRVGRPGSGSDFIRRPSVIIRDKTTPSVVSLAPGVPASPEAEDPELQIRTAFDKSNDDTAEVAPMGTTPEPPSNDVVADSSSPMIEMFEQETPLCPTISRYVYPKRGITKDQQAKFIINSPETAYIQAVRVETCHRAGSVCSISSDFSLIDFGIRTVCRQKYSYRRMLALNENGSEEVDFFKFPTACTCFQIEEKPFRSGSIPFTDPTTSDLVRVDSASNEPDATLALRSSVGSGFSHLVADSNSPPPRKKKQLEK